MMKTTNVIRRSIIILVVVILAISLTGCTVDATVQTQISADGKQFTVYSTRRCLATVEVQLSTGESMEMEEIELSDETPKILSLEQLSSKSYSVYLDDIRATITDVNVKDLHDGWTPANIAFFIFIMIILLVGGCLIIFKFAD